MLSNVANPDFLAGTSLVFSMYINMNNKLTLRPTFTEMTLLLMEKKLVFDNSFANFAADVAITVRY